MNVARIAVRLARGELHYALGRFETVRHGYSLFRRVSRRSGSVPSDEPSLFPAVSVDAAVAALRRDSIALGFDLPASIVQDLVHHARTVPLFDRADPDRRFICGEVSGGRLPDGTEVVLGLVPEPMVNPAVRRICRDPLLLEAASRFLGYQPKKIIPRLFWSFTTSMEDEERRRRGQTIDWHYDVHDFNFVSANFYLTDVDREAGAHALVRGSHGAKPLRLLMGSANAPNETILALYGADRQLVVEGPSGLGFLEDTSCYHRAIAPLTRDRLMMQIWFS